MNISTKDEEIPLIVSSFIKENKIATICCVSEKQNPYCFSCFYSFEEKMQLLFFKSSDDSYHSQVLLKNSKVSGTILPGITNLLSVKGIQFSGKILYDIFPENVNPKNLYHQTFPLALARSGSVWCIQLEQIKFTDNTIVFGKKVKWCRSNFE